MLVHVPRAKKLGTRTQGPIHDIPTLWENEHDDDEGINQSLFHACRNRWILLQTPIFFISFQEAYYLI